MYLIIRCSESSAYIFIVKNHHFESEIFSQLKMKRIEKRISDQICGRAKKVVAAYIFNNHNQKW